MKIGCVIRSVGERTEKLCIESVKQFIREENIHLVKNVKPFSKAVGKMLDIAEQNNYDWYFGLDADIVLVENWMSLVEKVFEEDVSGYYKIEFPIMDRFVNHSPLYGVHFYNGEYTQKMRDILKLTKDEKKPEGNIRHKIGVPVYHLEDHKLGYHGFEQYYKDIFCRFALRYKRNPRYAKRFKVFNKMDEEREIAKLGWQFSKKNDFDFMHADNKKLYKGKEIEPLDISLDEFYKKMEIFHGE